MEDLRETLLATSIRMYSLHHLALSLCSVKSFDELIADLLPHCITVMDVATACLITPDGMLHTQGAELPASDQTELIGQLWKAGELVRPAEAGMHEVHSSLPSSGSFIASTIQRETQILGTLIVVNKEVCDFQPTDFQRIQDLATVAATALENVYEYEGLLHQTEDLQEDIKRREKLELQRLRQELEDARRTQLSLLPIQSPRMAGYDIFGTCHPAFEVGGDFFDYVPLADDTVAIVLADVVGKGMKSAMHAVLSYGVLHAEAKFNLFPFELLSILNGDLYLRFQDRMNCAMCIATIDAKEKILRYSNAGMPYPLVKRGNKVFEIESNGMPLGAFRHYEYEDVRQKFQPGDIIVFISDGITEAPSKDDDEQLYIDTKRLFSVIGELDVNLSSQAISDAILEDVFLFSGRTQQSDDMTIVVVKVT